MTASTRSKSTSPRSACAPPCWRPSISWRTSISGRSNSRRAFTLRHSRRRRSLAQVAVADIGAVAVRLLEDPDRFAGKRFDLGGDELTGNEAIAVLSRVTGRPFTYLQVPLDVIRQRMGEDGAKMYEWFDRVGYTFDRAALRREFPDVAFHDFESWAKAQDWKTLLQTA